MHKFTTKNRIDPCLWGGVKVSIMTENSGVIGPSGCRNPLILFPVNRDFIYQKIIIIYYETEKRGIFT